MNFNNLSFEFFMKKHFILPVLLVFTSTMCFAGNPQMLHFSGISFDMQGWNLITENDDGEVSILGYKDDNISFIDIEKFVSDGERILNGDMVEDIIDDISENDMEVVSKSNIKSTEINGIKAKYVDLKLKQDAVLFARIYCVEKGGYTIIIITTSKVSTLEKHLEQFSNILNTFKFSPK